MKKNTIKTMLGLGMLAMMLAIVPVAAHANENAGDNMAAIKAKADTAITKRIDMLNKVITKIADMKKISADDKATLTAKLNGEIGKMNTLKAKIDADTDLATLKADAQSITKSYREFMVIRPQTVITAAADRMDVTADMLTDIAGKLQVRITAASAAGKDVSSLNTSLASMNAKIADAHTQYENAETAVAPLLPDNGVQSVIDSNKAALLAAKTNIKTGAQDLKDARDLAKTINKSLKDLGF